MPKSSQLPTQTLCIFILHRMGIKEKLTNFFDLKFLLEPLFLLPSSMSFLSSSHLLCFSPYPLSPSSYRCQFQKRKIVNLKIEWSIVILIPDRVSSHVLRGNLIPITLGYWQRIQFSLYRIHFCPLRYYERYWSSRCIRILTKNLSVGTRILAQTVTT